MSERDTRRRAQKCCARGCSLRPRRLVRTAPAHCCFAARQRSPASWRDGCLPSFLRTSSPGTRCPVWPRLSIGRVATSWAAQRADRILTAALQDSFGAQYRDSVCHPISDRPERRGGMFASRRRPPSLCRENVRHRVRPGHPRQLAGTSGAIGTSRLATGRRCCCRSRAVRGPSTVGDRRAIH